MKNIIWILLLAGVLTACGSTANKTETENADSTKITAIDTLNTTQAIINIKGMTCTGCEKTVTEALKAVDGVVDAAASFNDGVAKVRYNKKKVELAALAKAIENKGYQVTGTKE
jgi:copper chaperone CopZ